VLGTAHVFNMPTLDLHLHGALDDIAGHSAAISSALIRAIFAAPEGASRRLLDTSGRVAAVAGSRRSRMPHQTAQSISPDRLDCRHAEPVWGLVRAVSAR
jgi:hypothetical protein